MTDIYSLTVSVGQESRGSSVGWFRFGVFHKTALKLSAEATVTEALMGLEDPLPCSLTQLMARSFGTSPCGLLYRLIECSHDLAPGFPRGPNVGQGGDGQRDRENGGRKEREGGRKEGERENMWQST